MAYTSFNNGDSLSSIRTKLNTILASLDAVVNDTTKCKFTIEGGLAIKLTNRTGVSSVKGSVVSASTAYDNAFTLQSNEFDSIGIVYDSGVADGSECWVVVSGIAEVLIADGTASTRGNWVIAHATDGRADASQPTPSPNNTLNEHTMHFKEIGHSLESKSSGTNVLVKCSLHQL